MYLRKFVPFLCLSIATFLSFTSLINPKPVQGVIMNQAKTIEPFFDTESPYNEDSSTHLWIVRRGIMLANLQGIEGQNFYNLFKPDNIQNPYKGDQLTNPFQNALCKGLYDADFNAEYNNPAIESGDFIAQYYSHFYDPETGKNWLGDNDPTAVSMGTTLWFKSIHSWLNGQKDSAGYYLGVSLHYLTDLGQPMHSSNFTAIDEPHKGVFFDKTDNWHLNFEAWVMNHQNDYHPPLDKFYNWPDIRIIPFDLFNSLAIRSHQMYKDFEVGPYPVCLGRVNKESPFNDCEKGKGLEETYLNNVQNKVVGNNTGLLNPMLENAIESVSQFVVAWNKEILNSKSVRIGDQQWMDKNLDVSHYRDGSLIPQVQDSAQWYNLKTGAWCYFSTQGDPTGEKYGAAYGKLYNWYAVNDSRGLAPEGWHVPGETEWSTLISSAGGTLVAGSNLMLTGNNSTGWGGKLGGMRSGRFSALEYWGAWWSSTEDTIINQFVDNPYTNAKLTVTAKGSNSLSITSEQKYNGFSVRCLRD